MLKSRRVANNNLKDNKTKKNGNTHPSNKWYRDLNNLIKPLIFNNPLKNFITNHKQTFTPQEYITISETLYESQNGKTYRLLSSNILKNNSKDAENLILYMNFKSHNILDDSKREKLFNIIDIYNPNVICLSEALLPNKIYNNKNPKTNTAKIVSISSIKDDTITQPFKASKLFTEKKMKDNNGTKNIKNKWKSFFLKHGYNYIVFANPTECPWGENWGNCIITKDKPLDAQVLQMGSYGKEIFGAPESRSLIMIKINEQNPEYICSTQLNDRDDISNKNTRLNQAKEIITFLKKIKSKNITLVGDLNSANKASYTESEFKILKLLNLNQNPIPTATINLFNKSNLFGKLPINTYQKTESIYQKCVTHVYSNKYKNCIMIFTDATEFDHQPLFVW
jgi:hypothetical protein